jgi:hypothetical protein
MDVIRRIRTGPNHGPVILVLAALWGRRAAAAETKVNWSPAGAEGFSDHGGSSKVATLFLLRENRVRAEALPGEPSARAVGIPSLRTQAAGRLGS